MRNLIINLTVAATITTLFALMLSAQSGAATAAARPKTDAAYVVAANPYLPIQTFEPAY
jgi:hypothetical protein